MTLAWRVDAHHHLWDLEVRPQPWIDPDTMAPIARSFGVAELQAAVAGSEIAATVAVQTVPVAAETLDLLRTAAEEPLVAGVVGWVDLQAPDVAARLGRLVESQGGNRLVGIRHTVESEPDPEWLDRADVRRGLDAVATAGLVFDLLVRPRQLPAAVRAAQRHPDLRFVLDHLGKPPLADGALDAWKADVRRLAALPSVDAKLSGLVTEARTDWEPADLRPVVDLALSTFGADRLMFGSDWPVCLLAASSYGQWVDTAEALLRGMVSPAERQAVFSGTATRAYRLGDA